MALIRDGNGTRSFETLMRYRNAAIAEFMRALRTLKALQAEAADLHAHAAGADLAREALVTPAAAPSPMRARPTRPAARRAPAARQLPNEPEPLMAYPLPAPPLAGPARHEPSPSPAPNEPETGSRNADIMTPQPQHGGALHEEAASWLPNEPEPSRERHEATMASPPHDCAPNEPEPAPAPPPAAAAAQRSTMPQ
jgi:hypothetical protein